MAVNTEFSIPSKALLANSMRDDRTIPVELPYEMEGVRARLISYVWREGQV